MPKKIYDIKPPKAAKKIVKKAKEIIAEEVKLEKIIEKATLSQRATVAKSVEKKKSKVLPIVIGSAVVLIGVATFLYIKLPRVDIKIWPKLENLTASEEIIADKEISLVDVSKKVIPAKYVEVTKESEEDFASTGSADDSAKASGTITISNKYSPATPLTLKVGTHFMSDGGKLFVTTQKVVVPASKKSGSKVIPGTVSVGVVAVEGGTAYNVAPSNFSVPGLKGTVFYFSISASSKEAFTGGVDGKVKKVTDDDIQSAKDELVKKLNEEAKNELKKQITDEYILLENGISTSTVNAATQTKVGTVAEKFKYKASVKANAVVFKRADIDEYAKELLVTKLADGKTLLDSSLKVDYTAKLVNISDGKITIELSATSDTYQALDKNEASLALMGKNEAKIRETIDNLLKNNIEKIQVKFWPFWVSEAPKSQKSVHIFLEFK